MNFDENPHPNKFKFLVERKKREDTGSVLREGHKAETVKKLDDIYDIIKDHMI